jgi:hypothetical protein
MKKRFGCREKWAMIFGLILLFFFIYWAGEGKFYRPSVSEAKITPETEVIEEEEVIIDKEHPAVKAAMAAQRRHHHHLMALPEAVGTAIGLSKEQKPVILVFTKKSIHPGWVPERVDGTPVVAKVTGEIFAMKNFVEKGIPNTAVWPTPVPIGVSTGNEGECSAGTIGARVKGNGKVYALSNNHVYALENKAPIRSRILQPGLYDTRCNPSKNNVIGWLSDFVEIKFNGEPNIVDAAIAESSTDLLGNGTPPGGYGTPNSNPAVPVLNMAVQKYGRTTSLTKGTITGINATINVSYSSGTAMFVNQIVVRSRKPFIKAGDSGSLLVTDNASANPVGLLFAGNSSGNYAIANPIRAVLDAFGVTIDGK